METKIIEATNGEGNHGRFLVGRFDSEWSVRSVVDPYGLSVLGSNCTDPKALLVYDLVTCEGASFSPGGPARADLDKHKIHVCVLFEAFLVWLYEQDLSDLQKLPAHVEVSAPFGVYGFRRSGR